MSHVLQTPDSFGLKLISHVAFSTHGYFSKNSFVIWDGVHVVRRSLALRQKSQCTTQFTEDCAGTVCISFKKSMFGEQLVWAEYENNCCKTNAKDLL